MGILARFDPREVSDVKRFMVPCQFGAEKAPFPLYVGEPADDVHPLEQQAAWLQRERGGSVPIEVMNSFHKLHNIALEHNVSFEELCIYAMDEARKLDDDHEDGTSGGGDSGE